MYSIEQVPPIVSNRSRVEILDNILNVAERATLKTHIMYKANLSHRQLEKYLGFLEHNEMLLQVLDIETGIRRYKVTDKGIDFLKDYAHLSNAYGPEILRK
jgi:predicted transcriptional regulator